MIHRQFSFFGRANTMIPSAYRYHFTDDVSFDEVEETLVLAVMAVESLHGPEAVRLEAGYALDPAARTCLITADTRVGRDLNKLFAGFLNRGFEAAVYHVERVDERTASTAAR